MLDFFFGFSRGPGFVAKLLNGDPTERNIRLNSPHQPCMVSRDHAILTPLAQSPTAAGGDFPIECRLRKHLCFLLRAIAAVHFPLRKDAIDTAKVLAPSTNLISSKANPCAIFRMVCSRQGFCGLYNFLGRLLWKPPASNARKPRAFYPHLMTAVSGWNQLSISPPSSFHFFSLSLLLSADACF